MLPGTQKGTHPSMGRGHAGSAVFKGFFFFHFQLCVSSCPPRVIFLLISCITEHYSFKHNVRLPVFSL